FGKLEFGLDDHAQTSVSTDGAVKNFGIQIAIRIDEFAACEHDLDFSYRQDQRSEPDVPPVHVDAERSANREVRVGLHDLHREVVRIDEPLNVAPAYAGLDANRAVEGRKRDHTIEASHVQMKTSLACGLASHAEPAAAD